MGGGRAANWQKDCKHVKHQRKYLNKYLRSMHKHETNMQRTVRPCLDPVWNPVLIRTPPGQLANSICRPQSRVTALNCFDCTLRGITDQIPQPNGAYPTEWAILLPRRTLRNRKLVKLANRPAKRPIQILKYSAVRLTPRRAYYSWHLQFQSTLSCYTSVCVHVCVCVFDFNLMQTFVQLD